MPGLISAINMWSVKWSARLQNVLTVAKLVRLRCHHNSCLRCLWTLLMLNLPKVGMAVLIIGGLVSMATNGMGNFQTGQVSISILIFKKRGIISDNISPFQVLTNWTT